MSVQKHSKKKLSSANNLFTIEIKPPTKKINDQHKTSIFKNRIEEYCVRSNVKLDKPTPFIQDSRSRDSSLYSISPNMSVKSMSKFPKSKGLDQTKCFKIGDQSYLGLENKNQSYQLQNLSNRPPTPNSKNRMIKSARGPRDRERKKSWEEVKIKFPILDVGMFMFEDGQDPLNDNQNTLKNQYSVFCTNTFTFKKLTYRPQQDISFFPIKHPNIINISGRVIIKNRTYFIKDSKDNFPLPETIKDYKLPYKQSYLKRRFEELVNALIFLHERQCFHNRIFPENIFLTKQGNFLLDLLASSGRAVKDSQKINYYYFLSPQHLLKDQIGEKNDVWALGCLLLYLSSQNFKTSKLHPYNYNYWRVNSVEEHRIIRQLRIKYGQTTENDTEELDTDENLSQQIKSFINKCLRINPKHRLAMIQLNFDKFLG